MVATEVIDILTEVLALDRGRAPLTVQTPLLGGLPEFDSMAVVTVLTAIEEHYDLIVDDDEVDAEVFASVGSLVGFVERKIAE